MTGGEASAACRSFDAASKLRQPPEASAARRSLDGAPKLGWPVEAQTPCRSSGAPWKLRQLIEASTAHRSVDIPPKPRQRSASSMRRRTRTVRTPRDRTQESKRVGSAGAAGGRLPFLYGISGRTTKDIRQRSAAEHDEQRQAEQEGRQQAAEPAAGRLVEGQRLAVPVPRRDAPPGHPQRVSPEGERQHRVEEGEGEEEDGERRPVRDLRPHSQPPDAEER